MPNAVIPEFIDSKAVRALPEFANLSRYGGATYEANLEAAAKRAYLLRDEMHRRAMQISSFPARDLLGTGYQLDKNSISLGEEIPASSIAILRSAALESRESLPLARAAQKVAGAKNPSSAFYGEDLEKSLAFFVQFLRSDDPNLTVDETVDSILERGVKFTPARGSENISPFGSIRVPFKVTRTEQTKNGFVTPSVDMSPYRASVGALNNFYSNNLTPTSLRPEKTSLVISATNELASAEYTRVTTLVKKDGFSGVQGVNIATNTYGNVVPMTNENESLDLVASTVTNNTIIINHESASKTTSAFQIDPVIETVLHEYGHTVESNTLGVTWGWNANSKTEAYAEVKARKVSEYGENNIREHFAESFAKYLGAGQASKEFRDFLENQVGIKELSLDTLVPKAFQNDTFVDGLEKYINESVDLGGYTLKITSKSNNTKDADLRSLLKRKGDSRHLGISITWEGNVYDSQGRSTGGAGLSRNLKVDPITGEIIVNHLQFKLGDSVQGLGLGDKITKATVEYYKSMEVDRITTSAAATDGYPNGAYMWALQGFDFADPFERDLYHNRTKLAYAGLSEYAADSERYDSMNFEEASREIARKTNFDQAALMLLITELRRSGWVISNDLLNQLKSVADKSDVEITPKLIAEIGRGNKKEKGKEFSTLGRHIMVKTKSGWKAVMELKN